MEREARELTGLLRNRFDPEVGEILGWYHWLRFAVTDRPSDADAALSLFTAFLLSGRPVENVPDDLLPNLAGAVSGQAGASTEPALLDLVL
ncbi:hypothetical protein AB0E25_41595 [Streptomyces bobili]|uniref:hypothetical protein n=1 Tax=Streptomyces bobili TaxID=67280 RepID=UPI00340501AD